MICPEQMKNGQCELIEINGGEELIDKRLPGIHPGVRIEKKYGLWPGAAVLTGAPERSLSAQHGGADDGPGGGDEKPTGGESQNAGVVYLCDRGG